MKTKLFLIATLLISTITFSQTSRKGYNSDDYNYKNSSNTKMNKAELIDAMAKDAGNSKTSHKGRNPQTGKEIKGARNTNSLPTGKRTYKTNSKTNPGNQKTEGRHNWMNNPSRARSSKQELEQTKGKNLRIRPIDGKREMGILPKDNNLRKKPGRTKADHYNSSRSNKNSNH